VVDGANVQIGGFQAAERALHLGQIFISADSVFSPNRLLGKVGADDVKAIQCGFGGDGPTGDISPTGRPVRIAYIHVLRFRDGKHVSFNLMFDRLSMLISPPTTVQRSLEDTK
jgi:hypothetical protein